MLFISDHHLVICVLNMSEYKAPNINLSILAEESTKLTKKSSLRSLDFQTNTNLIFQSMRYCGGVCSKFFLPLLIQQRSTVKYNKIRFCFLTVSSRLGVSNSIYLGAAGG